MVREVVEGNNVKIKKHEKNMVKFGTIELSSKTLPSKNSNSVKKSKYDTPTKTSSSSKTSGKISDKSSVNSETKSSGKSSGKSSKILSENRSSSGQKSNGLNESEKLYKFLSKYRYESKKKSGLNMPLTHTSMGELKGSYNIPDDKDTIFIQLYTDAILAGYRPSLVERHKEFGPILIDLDFTQEKKDKKRFYTETTILNIVKIYNSIIKKYLKVDSKTISAFVMEKKAPNLRNQKYHDGIHIVYPYICTTPSLQMLMRKKFIKQLQIQQILKRIPYIGTLDDVVDKSVIYKNGWMMYGSSKGLDCHPYYVTHIYTENTQHTFKNVENDQYTYDILIPGDNMMHESYVKHFIKNLRCRQFFSEDDLTPFLPDIDPLVIDKKIKSITESLKSNIKNYKLGCDVSELIGKNINYIKAVGEEQLIEAKNLIKLFSKKRASHYHDWYQVGKCLHNIDYRLLDDWIEFSKKTTRKNFIPDECEALWRKMKSSSYSIATLHYFASKDNPEEYLKMKEERLNRLIKHGMEATHRTIANLLTEKYKFKFKCASIKHSVWYQFQDHRWVEIDSAYALRNLISDDLVQDYANQQSYYYSLSTDKNLDAYEKGKHLEEAARITKVIKSLNNSQFKNGVVRECADILYDPTFIKNIDENIYLIGFDNGVYDLDSKIFRDGCPDDYISLSTGYNYIPYDKNDDINKNIKDFLRKIQPVKEMRHYLLRLLSTCLAGSISEENFYVWTGSGANGKSKLMELLKYSFGDLFKPMDILVITGKRTSASNATPELADKKGIRICPLDEPKSTDEINTGFMKIFTGGDMITARALFKEPIYFKPQFKPFLLCNQLPNIKSDDEGTWRRLKVIPFLSKFLKQSDMSKKKIREGLGENQFWADNTLSEQLPEWKEMFMGKLIKNYYKYKKYGLQHPKLVTKYTSDYRKKCDVYQDFFGDYLEKTDKESDVISIVELHDGMRTWYKKNYDGKCGTTRDLRNYITQRIPTYNKKIDSITYHKIKTDLENVENICDELDNA